MAERWVSFDCYGTLVDWMTGLRAALQADVGPLVDRVLASTLAFAFAFEQDRPHRLYRDILVEALRRAVAQEGVEVPSDRLLVDAWAQLPVFPEVRSILRDLQRRGWRLGVLTNCDDDLFAATEESLGVPFDEVVTAEQVQAYKPALGHFEEFRRRTRTTPGSWAHVANSWVADVVPTSRLGIPCIWVNRDGDTNDPALAARVLPDFSRLPQELERLLPADPPRRARG